MPNHYLLHDVLKNGGILVPAGETSRVTCAFWGNGSNHYLAVRRYCLHETPTTPGSNEVRLYEGDVYPPRQPWTNASDWPLPRRTATEFNVNTVIDFISADVDTWLYCYCSDHTPMFRKKINAPPHKLDEVFYGVDSRNSDLAAVQFRIYIGRDFPPVRSIFGSKPDFFNEKT